MHPLHRLIFSYIMACETVKEVWDKLKKEYQGSDQTRQIRALNLWRKFEVLKMKKKETIKDYNNQAMKTVNQLRLLGENLNEKRIVNQNIG